MQIRFHIIPHSAMRYDTVGDWLFDEHGDLDVYCAVMGEPNYELLVLVHEMHEALLCRKNEVLEEDVCAFDMAYEECRRLKLPAPCGCFVHEEPGNDPHAPYHREHVAATIMEMGLAQSLGVDWEAYDNCVVKL